MRWATCRLIIRQRCIFRRKIHLTSISLIWRVQFPFAKHNKPNAPREFFRVILDNSRRVRPRKKSPDYDIFARALTIGRRNLKNVESLTIRPASASYWMPAGELNKQLQGGFHAILKVADAHQMRTILITHRQVKQEVLDRGSIDIFS